MKQNVKYLILASGSVFRQKLLASTGLPFVQVKPNVDESGIKARTPTAIAKARAEAKARAVAVNHPEGLVIACDQVLEFSKKAYGKASSRAEAAATLKKFSGKTHYLLSALCLATLRKGKPVILWSQVVKVAMPMRRLSSSEIAAYLDTGEWEGCAGCYQFENRGMNLFKPFKADTSAIIGLPLLPLLEKLRTLGVKAL